jgi:hypothetical protein
MLGSIFAACESLPRMYRIEQETQGRSDILAEDTTVFLISHAAAVTDNAEEHQCGCTLVRLQPQGFLDFL